MIAKPVTIILPTYNEKDNIIPLIDKIISCFNPYEIIVVDDNSPDKTAEILMKYSIKYPSIKVVINKYRMGLTGSINTGIKNANNNYITWMDADFSHPPELLMQMYKALDENDIAVGSWLIHRGNEARREKTTVFFSYIINKLCQILFTSKIKCYTSGFIMTRKKVLEKFPLKGDYGEYCINFLVMTARKNYRIKEIPFKCESRLRGVSKTGANYWEYILRGRKYITTIIELVFRKYFIPIVTSG